MVEESSKESRKELIQSEILVIRTNLRTGRVAQLVRLLA
jgi:hypothetical protein